MALLFFLVKIVPICTEGQEVNHATKSISRKRLLSHKSPKIKNIKVRLDRLPFTFLLFQLSDQSSC